jgi:hypothetical protein
MEYCQKLPHHRLKTILTAWKLIWGAHEHWSAELGGTQLAIYETNLSSWLDKLKIAYNAVQGELQELMLVSSCYSCKEDIIEKVYIR